METKANYVLIGATTLAGIVASLGFLLWFAHFSINRQFDYNDILFDQVTGLSNTADVQFNGITVGRVVEITINPRDAARVRVRIEVNADTPIRSDTMATLQSQGVTGVSFVSLSTGNERDATPLKPDPETGIPIIPSRPSTLYTLLETVPELLREARDLLQGLSAFTGKENQERVSTILDNVASASDGLDEAIVDVSNISGQIRQGVGQIAAFTGKLDGISQQLTKTLATAETTLSSATGAFDEAKGTLTTGDVTKRLGNYRVWVACDDPIAVAAGRQVFMNKFLTPYTYNVPSLNNPKASKALRIRPSSSSEERAKAAALTSRNRVFSSVTAVA